MEILQAIQPQASQTQRSLSEKRAILAVIEAAEMPRKVQSSAVRSQLRAQVASAGDLPCWGRQKRELVRTLDGFSRSLQGGSLVVYGPQGAGKSSLVAAAEAELSESRLHLVWLDGSVQTSDGEALEEVAAQLESQLELEDAGPASYGALLARILTDSLPEDRGLVVVMKGAELFTTHHNQVPIPLCPRGLWTPLHDLEGV